MGKKERKFSRNERKAFSIEKGKIRLRPYVCLLWNLPGKLVLAESQHIASNLRHNLALILSSAMLQNVLDDIVAILVLNKTPTF